MAFKKMIVECNARLTYDWIRCFGERRADFVKKIIVAPGKLLYNLDETSLSDWEGSKSKPVLVPTTLGDAIIHHPVIRQIRYQTLFCCSSASGDVYYPLLISAKQSVLQLLKVGFVIGWICESKSQNPQISRKSYSSNT
jgi:hypothetical protein